MDGEGQTLAFDVARTHVSGSRYLAHLVDGICFWLVAIVPLVAAAVISNAALAITFVFLLVPGHIAYFVLTQQKTGRSPGKRFVGIRVVTATGDVPSRSALLKRTLPLIVEYFYIFAWASMMASEERQRFGDRWAHTFVIDDEERTIEGRAANFDFECGVCGERFAAENLARYHVGQSHEGADPATAVVRLED